MTHDTANPSTAADVAGAPAHLVRWAELLLCAAGLFVSLRVVLNTVLARDTDIIVRAAGAAVGSLLIWVYYPRRTTGKARARWALARTALLGAIVVAAVLETESANRRHSQRARASEMILAAQPYRNTISARLNENPRRTDPGRDMPPLEPRQGVQAHVAPDGTITMSRQWRNGDPASNVRIVLTPRIDPATNGVVWTCRGEPLSWMPATCR